MIKLKYILLIPLFAIMVLLYPNDVSAIYTPFGGPSVFGVPCTCSSGNAVWFWNYSGVTNPLGLWTYPGAKYKLQASQSQGSIFLTPGIQALGEYNPVYSSQCQIYAGTSCVSLPLQGILPSTAEVTSTGVGSSGTPAAGITSVAAFASFAAVAEKIFDDAKNSAGSGCGVVRESLCIDEKQKDKQKPLEIPVLCDTVKQYRGAIGKCDNQGPKGFACRPSKKIVEVDERVNWYIEAVGGGSSDFYVSWVGTDIKPKMNERAFSVEYKETGIKKVDVYLKNAKNEEVESVTCSLEVVEKKSSTLKASCMAAQSVVSNIGVDPLFTHFKEVTWIADAKGGVGPYTYKWTGEVSSDKQKVKKSYLDAETGERTSNVFVTSADGQTASASCSLKVVGK